MTDKMEGFRAIAYLIEHQARVDPNPLIGQVYPKGFEYLMKFSSQETCNK